MKPEIKSDYPILASIKKRWSPRVFDEKEIAQEDLNTLFEAARWAASCFNDQPWRFIVGHQGTEKYDKILATLMEANQEWAKKAPVLVLNVVKTTFNKNGKANAHAEHDMGLALGNLSNQATSMGIYLHHMAGLDAQAAHKAFDLPKDLKVLTAMAIGYPKNPNDLSDAEKKAEFGTQERFPLEDLFL